MPTPTYTPLANVTLSSTATVVQFTSISQNYSDLILVIAAATPSGAEQSVYARFNNDSGTTYNSVDMYAYSGATASGSMVNGTSLGLMYMPSGVTPGIYGLSKITIMDYSATNKNKTAVWRQSTSGSSTGLAHAGGGRWASTAAINSIYLYVNGGNNFTAGSTFTLYGVAA